MRSITTSNSWRISVPFDEQQHLFSGYIETDYVIDGYSCVCGHNEFILRHGDEEITYCCNCCENKNFYDANLILEHPGYAADQFMESDFDKQYELNATEHGISSECVINIACELDFANRKIIYTKKTIHNLELDYEGIYKELYWFEGNNDGQIEKNLISYAIDSNLFNVELPKDISITLNMIAFFIKYRSFKEFDLYYWVDLSLLDEGITTVHEALASVANYRKEKSIKRAVFKDYTNQLIHKKKYYPQLVFLFSKYIDDSNLVVKLINLSFTDDFMQKINYSILVEVIIFLKKHYSEQQVYKLFVQIALLDVESSFFYDDMIKEFAYSPEDINNNFTKVACKLEALHDEFVRCTNHGRYVQSYNTKLYYTEKEKSSCEQIEQYMIKLPYTGDELAAWANRLKNCMFGYVDLIARGMTKIYGFFIDDKIMFAVEISNNMIIQARGVSNRTLSADESKILDTWFHKYFECTSIYNVSHEWEN